MNRFAYVCMMIVFAIAFAFPNPVRAGQIYDSGIPLTGLTSAILAGDGSFSSSDFQIGTAAAINEVHWNGLYEGNSAPATDSFTIRFYDYSGSVPSAAPLFTYDVGNVVNRMDTGINNTPLANFNIYSYDAVIPSSALAAGQYVFSVEDATTDTTNRFFWTFGPSAGHTIFRNGAVVDTNSATNFALFGSQSVPEPTSLLMLGTGVVFSMVYVNRRRKRVGVSE